MGRALWCSLAVGILLVSYFKVNLNTYNSVVMQTIYYLGRPHQGVLMQELKIPSAWKGAELAASTDTVYAFSRDEQAELTAIVKSLTDSGE
jgi:hypothetical protein